jgi:hypothetical protein
MSSAYIGTYHATIASSRRALEGGILRLHTLGLICARALPQLTSKFDTTEETSTVKLIRMVALKIGNRGIGAFVGGILEKIRRVDRDCDRDKI